MKKLRAAGTWLCLSSLVVWVLAACMPSWRNALLVVAASLGVAGWSVNRRLPLSRHKDVWDAPRGPRFSVDDAVAHVEQRFPGRGEIVVCPSPCSDKEGSSRWIFFLASEPGRWIEPWLPSHPQSHSMLWQGLRQSGFDPTWGSALAKGHVVPGAVHSWDFIVTLGPKPLRIWKRRIDEARALVDFRDGLAKGLAFEGHSHPLAEIGRARIEKRWLIEVCVLSTPAGEAKVAWRVGWARGLALLLATLAGVLNPNPEKVASETPLELLARRINECLARA